jgi:3,4-dihydroxy 2-butanone 4-phosphate synthase/GTP cyclohydrolase II
VRAHAEYLPGDVFGSADRNTAALLRRAMEMINAEGCGVILYLRREGQGVELVGSGRRPTATTRPSTESSARAMEFREYGIGAQILRDVGVGKIRLLTNYPRRMVSLPGYGLEIVECVPVRVGAPRRAAKGKPDRTKHEPPRRLPRLVAPTQRGRTKEGAPSHSAQAAKRSNVKV